MHRHSPPSSYRRFDLVRCETCGRAQIANSHHAVCGACHGVAFRRYGVTSSDEVRL